MGEFKRIAVTAAEDDDEVIVAGIGAEADVSPKDDERAGETQEPESERADDRQRPAPVKKPSESTPSSAAAPRGKKRPRDDGHHETTLEDLKPEPMPAAQKITIIAVVAILVIAIVYYFAFLR